MQTIIGFTLLSASLHCCRAARLPTFAGPYKTHVDRIVSCDGESTPMNWTFFLRTSRYNPYKPNEDQILSGNVTSTETFDDTAWIEVRFAVRANNEWKKNAFVMRFPSKACSTFRSEFPSFYYALYKGASHTGVCSKPPATYHVNGPVDWAFPKVKVFPYGTYDAVLRVGLAGSKQPSMCMAMYSQVLPKNGV